MNARTILILLLLCTGISVWLYHTKTAPIQHDIDKTQSAVNIISRSIKPGTAISYYGEPNRVELYMWTRYVFAPRLVPHGAITDTVFSIQLLQGGDSLLNAYIAGRHILSQAADGQYRYLLTTKQVIHE